jgi:ABC-type branched-subunit amino acid transport system substrate-binding protein
VPVIEEKVLKVGVLSPFTGPSIMIGEQAKNAVTMAFEKIDYRIGAYEIELVWIDSQSDPNEAANAYDKAVRQDGIEAGRVELQLDAFDLHHMLLSLSRSNFHNKGTATAVI